MEKWRKKQIMVLKCLLYLDVSLFQHFHNNVEDEKCYYTYLIHRRLKINRQKTESRMLVKVSWSPLILLKIQKTLVFDLPVYVICQEKQDTCSCYVLSSQFNK